MSRRWRRLSRIMKAARVAPRGVDLPEQRPFDAYGIVVAWRHLARRVAVVDDVDAADEGDACVDGGEFAVQPAQAVAAQAQQRHLGPIDEDLDPARGEFAADSGHEIARAEAVD